MGDSRYKDNLTTLAKRLRPLMLSIAEGAMNANEWDDIILVEAGGGTTIYPTTDAGLIAALAAASSGDTVIIPAACNISGGPWTVASGVALVGYGFDSQLTGNITIVGILHKIKITGSVTNSGGLIWNNRIVLTSGTGLTQTSGTTNRTSVYTSGTATGIDITGGELLFSEVTWTGGTPKAMIANGTIAIYNGRFSGFDGATIRSAIDVNNCSFEAFDGDALTHDSGTARLSNCTFRIDTIAPGVGSGNSMNITAGNITLTDCSWNHTVIGLNLVTYGQGDRGSYSVEDYHAADIEGAALLRHLPSPVGEDNNNIAYVNTNVWVVGSAADAGITGDDEKVGVSANDSTPGYLNGKLVAGTNITLTEGSDGGDETLTIASTDKKAQVSANDTTPGYLNGKLVAGTSITLTEGSDGGDETLMIASTASGGGYWEPVVDNDSDPPEFVFIDGDIVMTKIE